MISLSLSLSLHIYINIYIYIYTYIHITPNKNCAGQGRPRDVNRQTHNIAKHTNSNRHNCNIRHEYIAQEATQLIQQKHKADLVMYIQSCDSTKDGDREPSARKQRMLLVSSIMFLSSISSNSSSNSSSSSIRISSISSSSSSSSIVRGREDGDLSLIIYLYT